MSSDSAQNNELDERDRPHCNVHNTKYLCSALLTIDGSHGRCIRLFKWHHKARTGQIRSSCSNGSRWRLLFPPRRVGMSDPGLYTVIYNLASLLSQCYWGCRCRILKSSWKKTGQHSAILPTCCFVHLVFKALDPINEEQKSDFIQKPLSTTCPADLKKIGKP